MVDGSNRWTELIDSEPEELAELAVTTQTSPNSARATALEKGLASIEQRTQGVTDAQNTLTSIADLGFEPSQLCKFAAIAILKHAGNDTSIEVVAEDVGKVLAANAVPLSRAKIVELCIFVRQTSRTGAKHT